MSYRGVLTLGRLTGPTVGAGLLGQLAVLVSGVAAARILGVEDRGHLALLALFPIVLAFFGALGVPLAVTFHIARRAEATGDVVRAAWPVALAQGLAVLVLHAALMALFLNAPELRTAALLTLFVAPSVLVQQYALAVLQGQGRMRAYNVLRLVGPLTYAAWIAGLLVAAAGTLERVTFAWVAATTVIALGTVVWALRSLPPPSSRDVTSRSLLRFGLRSVIGSTSPIETLRVDQFVVGLLLSPAALGLYVVALALTNLPRFVAQSVGIIAYPQVAREPRARARRAAIWRFSVFAAVLCGAIVLLLEALVGALVPLLFGSEFIGAVSIARVLLLAALLISVRRVLADAARGAGYTGAGSVAEVASWVALGASLPLLTPLWGPEGVAASLVLSSLVSVALLWVFVARGSSRDADAPAVADSPTAPIAGDTGSAPGPSPASAFAEGGRRSG
jgi:O-antigen/teichoic acid export membrane protein